DNFTTSAHKEYIAHVDITRVDRPPLSRADHSPTRPSKHPDPVQRPLRSHLLDHAHSDIQRHDADRDEGIADFSQHCQGDPKRIQQIINRVKNILSRYLNVRTAGLHRHSIAKTLRASCSYLILRKTLRSQCWYLC